jgi:hypothetical protein
MIRHASCSCGQLRIACEGEPVRVGICHCLACQRRTGSAFGVQARFTRDKVTIEGTAREYVRIGDDGYRLVFRFCGDCGATVYYSIDDYEPDVVSVPVGAFADPSFPAPQYAVYEARRHPWVTTPASCVKRLE